MALTFSASTMSRKRFFSVPSNAIPSARMRRSSLDTAPLHLVFAWHPPRRCVELTNQHRPERLLPPVTSTTTNGFCVEVPATSAPRTWCRRLRPTPWRAAQARARSPSADDIGSPCSTLLVDWENASLMSSAGHAVGPGSPAWHPAISSFAPFARTRGRIYWISAQWTGCIRRSTSHCSFGCFIDSSIAVPRRHHLVPKRSA